MFPFFSKFFTFFDGFGSRIKIGKERKKKYGPGSRCSEIGKNREKLGKKWDSKIGKIGPNNANRKKIGKNRKTNILGSAL